MYTNLLDCLPEFCLLTITLCRLVHARGCDLKKQDDDPGALLEALREVRRCADRLVHAFHKISTSDTAGPW